MYAIANPFQFKFREVLMEKKSKSIKVGTCIKLTEARARVLSTNSDTHAEPQTKAGDQAYWFSLDLDNKLAMALWINTMHKELTSITVVWWCNWTKFVQTQLGEIQHILLDILTTCTCITGFVHFKI